MKRIASIMTLLAVFGWFLNPALALCCQDCDQCLDACQFVVAPTPTPIASCCRSGDTCTEAPQEQPIGQDCCSQCQCSLSNAPTAEPMLATIVVQSDHRYELELSAVALPTMGMVQELKVGLSPEPLGEPPGKQRLLQIQILRL
mgnify:CR=1 FL=1